MRRARRRQRADRVAGEQEVLGRAPRRRRLDRLEQPVELERRAAEQLRVVGEAEAQQPFAVRPQHAEQPAALRRERRMALGERGDRLVQLLEAHHLLVERVLDRALAREVVLVRLREQDRVDQAEQRHEGPKGVGASAVDGELGDERLVEHAAHGEVTEECGRDRERERGDPRQDEAAPGCFCVVGRLGFAAPHKIQSTARQRAAGYADPRTNDARNSNSIHVRHEQEQHGRRHHRRFHSHSARARARSHQRACTTRRRSPSRGVVAAANAAAAPAAVSRWAGARLTTR